MAPKALFSPDPQVHRNRGMDNLFLVKPILGSCLMTIDLVGRGSAMPNKPFWPVSLLGHPKRFVGLAYPWLAEVAVNTQVTDANDAHDFGPAEFRLWTCTRRTHHV